MEDQVILLARTTIHLTVIARLCAASLCSMLLFPAAPTVTSSRTSDEYLTGYVASILERDLLWERDSYRLKVTNGIATITLFKDDPPRREAADKQLHTLDGLQRITFVIKQAATDRPGMISRFLRVTGDTEAFPSGDYFLPLLADPKQPQFFVGFDRFQSSGLNYTMASVGFGETFGLYRFLGTREGNGLQFSLEGAIFAQFNMNTPSSDLVNADYTIGFPVTYRLGDHSLRARLYHQSSHLGDELLLSGRAPARVNLSYEAIELIYSYEWLGWRVYGGGEYLVHREPENLKSASTHWGIEYHASKALFWGGRPIVGVDMKKLEEHDWAIDTSVKAGLEFGHPSPGQRRLRLLAEYYKGLDPHGQFYVNKMESFGLGISLGF
jgi:hypothetical protein